MIIVLLLLFFSFFSFFSFLSLFAYLSPSSVPSSDRFVDCNGKNGRENTNAG